MTASKVIWCDRGWQPYHYGFCPDEAAWKREMKRLGLPDEPYPTTAGRCTHFTNLKTAADCTIITINEIRRPGVQVIGLIVHEAMHVWRAIRESIGEHSPSQEFEAYSLQSITQNLIYAYEQTRRKLTRA